MGQVSKLQICIVDVEMWVVPVDVFTWSEVSNKLYYILILRWIALYKKIKEYLIHYDAASLK